jgi:hypothetical protein
MGGTIEIPRAKKRAVQKQFSAFSWRTLQVHNGYSLMR